MPRMPRSRVDVAVDEALQSLPEERTRFLEMEQPPTSIPVRSLPAARNSEPYRNRRACAGNTNCIPICPIQAKYDPTITLNDAMNTPGVVKLRKGTVASEIVVGENGLVSEIKYIGYNTDTGERTETGCIK